MLNKIQITAILLWGIFSVNFLSFPVLGITTDAKKTLSFDTSIAEDATPEVLEKVMNSPEVEEIFFEPGTYHFYPDKGLEMFCRISNHNDVFVATAFPLLDRKNITIDGQGATFIFHGKMIPFIVENSKNIQLKNLTIDWYMPFHSEGLIVANDEEKGTFDMQISTDFPYEIRDNQLIFVKEYYEHTIGQSILYDRSRKAIMFDTESYTPVTTSKKGGEQYSLDSIRYRYKVDERAPGLRDIGMESRIWVEQLEPGLVRVHNHGKKMPPVGMVMAMKGEQGENRLAPAIRVVDSKDFQLSQVTVHHAGGMGLIVENTENIRIDHMVVSPSGDRVVSTTADATHFVGCRGEIHISESLFEGQLDDAANIHGTYQEVVERIDAHRLGVRMGHYQQQGFKIGRPGDKIGFVRLSESFFPFHELTLQDTEVLNGRYQILTFRESLPENIAAGDLLENIDAYPAVIIENCKIQGNRARGLLLSTPRSVKVLNNYFHTEMEAILVPVESGHWFEAGSARDLLIEGNTFENCVHSGQNRGVIRFITDDDEEHTAFEKIRIIGNTFRQFDPMILEVNNVDGFLFKANTIEYSDAFPSLFPDNPVVKINASKDLNFTDNTYKGKAKKMIVNTNQNQNIKFD
ncbi:alpha-1,3-galactosidase B [Echinicola pacifica]|uniref:Alpha-1,3-galactosidase B n=1 Tax=Echinicola pacifica TaxID=346377 RepID=A0A918Q9Q4_9BACT|nr:right-handed parallel beta-helix repeat-containing protein [Echinicola pacifica]GGZ39160.1 alpha-1,3-galactosidase B [Echinicola pacifica]